MSKEKDFTHLNKDGQPTMVDVSEKSITKRTAEAQAIVVLPIEVLNQFKNGDIVTKKGSVFHTAIIAGVMGAKKTWETIPFCHPIPLENCKIDIQLVKNKVHIHCTTSTTGKTGIEMEAIVGASTAAMTIYDMCKALSQNMVVTDIKLLSKTGGKSDYLNV